MATAPIITVKLEASDEREAIARFIEYTFDKNWVVQDVVDAIRNGLYLEHVRKLIAPQQSMHQTGLGLCEEEGCKQPAVVGYCSEHF